MLKYKQDGVLDENRMIGYVQKHNICNNYFNFFFASPAAGGQCDHSKSFRRKLIIIIIIN
jgi:hypothetical protein